MSRLRNVWIYDSNGDPIVLNGGRVPVYLDEKAVELYDSAGAPIVLNAGRVPVFQDEKEAWIKDSTGNDITTANPVPVSNYLSNGNEGIKFADSANLDAFARVRVSNPETLFENYFNYNLSPTKYSNFLAGTGAITHLPNESAAQLSTGGTASGARAVLQTRQYMRYQPGKSQLILVTANLGAAKANVRQRVGYYDDANGLFFEQTETAKSVNVRTSTSGSPVTTSVVQSSWNVDPLDGTGPSGITIDFSTSQIFFIDFEWLGIGRIRFGFFVDGVPIYCHEVLNANNLATVYMTTPHLPVRAEIENTGVAASTTTMRQFCTSVITEGGRQVDPTSQFAIGRGTASLGVTTRVPVLSIRPRTTFNSITNRGHVIFDSLEILAATNNCLWELVQGGTLTGASWTNVDTNNSITEYDTSATAISGGIVRNRGWALSGLGAATGRDSAMSMIELFNDYAGTNPEPLSIVCTAFTGTTNVNALMKWTEQK